MQVHLSDLFSHTLNSSLADWVVFAEIDCQQRTHSQMRLAYNRWVCQATYRFL